jgi:Domain of unknown function DUF29
MKVADLYEADFAEWTRQNAELLRSGRAAEADLAHIAEEIEDMGKRERRSLYRRMRQLIEHLLRWQYQPERRNSTWRRTIIMHRWWIGRLLTENPSFQPLLEDVVAESYQLASKTAALAISCPRERFPQTCPYALEQLLDENFLP